MDFDRLRLTVFWTTPGILDCLSSLTDFDYVRSNDYLYRSFVVTPQDSYVIFTLWSATEPPKQIGSGLREKTAPL